VGLSNPYILLVYKKGTVPFFSNNSPYIISAAGGFDESNPYK